MLDTVGVDLATPEVGVDWLGYPLKHSLQEITGRLPAQVAGQRQVGLWFHMAQQLHHPGERWEPGFVRDWGIAIHDSHPVLAPAEQDAELDKWVLGCHLGQIGRLHRIISPSHCHCLEHQSSSCTCTVIDSLPPARCRLSSHHSLSSLWRRSRGSMSWKPWGRTLMTR